MRILLLLGYTTLLQAAELRRYTVVVGNNRSLDPAVAPLEFADDDAARYAELFSAAGDAVSLHVVLDPSSQKVHGDAAVKSLPPTRSALRETLGRVFALARADRTAGHSVIFTLVLIGHGDVGPGGEGFLSLLDGPFSRQDLFREVLARSPAHMNHVIIDACNSYFLVHRRGAEADDKGPSRGAAVATYLGALEVTRYPNSGFLLSTSSAKESHEWSGFRAGVFSHEIRSALSGAADANGDGRISYGEVHAFVDAANLRVQDPRAHVDLHVVPPAIDVSAPLLDLTTAQKRAYLRIPAGAPFRFYIEDDRGVRVADAYTTGEQRTLVALAPQRAYYVRSSDGRKERRVEMTEATVYAVSPAELQDAGVSARGSIEATFQQDLFEEPYGASFFRGFAVAHGYTVAKAPAHVWEPLTVQTSTEQSGFSRRQVGWSLVAGTALLGGFAVWAQTKSSGAENEFADHVNAEGDVVGLSAEGAQELEDRARSYAWLRSGLLIGAGVAGAVGAGLLFWTPDAPNLAVLPNNEGAMLVIGSRY